MNNSRLHLAQAPRINAQMDGILQERCLVNGTERRSTHSQINTSQKDPNKISKASNKSTLFDQRQIKDLERKQDALKRPVTLSTRLAISSYVNKQSIQQKDSYRRELDKQIKEKHQRNRSCMEHDTSKNNVGLNIGSVNKSFEERQRRRSINIKANIGAQQSLNVSICPYVMIKNPHSRRSQSVIYEIYDAQPNSFRTLQREMSQEDSISPYKFEHNKSNLSFIQESSQRGKNSSINSHYFRNNNSNTSYSRPYPDKVSHLRTRESIRNELKKDKTQTLKSVENQNREAPLTERITRKGSMNGRRGSVTSRTLSQNSENRDHSAQPVKNNQKVNSKFEKNKLQSSHIITAFKKEREEAEGRCKRLINSTMRQLRTKKISGSNKENQSQH